MRTGERPNAQIPADMRSGPEGTQPPTGRLKVFLQELFCQAATTMRKKIVGLSINYFAIGAFDMVNFAETVLGYAQRLAGSLCDWPEEDWVGNELEWETMKKTSAPVPPAALSSTQVKIIRRATAFGTVAGRPQTHPSSVQWCRDRLRRLKRAAKQYGMADFLEPCFDIGYRTASARTLNPQATVTGAGQRTRDCSPGCH